MKDLMRVFTSLRFTAALLTLAMVLVFVGTLAQVEQGLYQAQARYFKSLFVYWAPGGGGLRIPVFPGGYLLGGLMLINLLVMGATRYRPFKKRFGLVLVHAGLALLFVGQFFTDLLSVESAMRFRVGETRNYSEDFHANEMVVVDATDGARDRVLAIPERMLSGDREVVVSGTPFRLRVREYWENADLLGRQVEGGKLSGADQGAGRGLYIVGKPPTTRMDERNLPAAVVEVWAGERELGRWLVSSAMGSSQGFEHEGRTWQLALRPRRHYMPFSLTLLDVRHDVYKGTQIPKNFSSRVRVRHQETGDDREVLIYMNNPLRYGGNTYYQYQMAAADQTSTLQVVRNPSWLTPYISCVLVGLGLTWQFLSHLVGFARGAPRVRQPAEWWLWALGTAVLVWALAPAFARGPKDGLDVRAFGRLPVLLNGRVQPMDSVARNSLLQLRGKQRAPTKLHFSVWSAERRGRTISATEWLLEVLFKPEVADTRKVFRVDHPELVALMKLPDKDVARGEDGKHFSFEQMRGSLGELERQMQRAREKESAQRTPLERQVMQLYGSLVLYQRLKNSVKPESVQDLAAEVAAYRESIAPGLRALHAREAGQEYSKEDFDRLVHHLHQFESVSRMAYPLVVPPSDPSVSRDAWENIGDVLMQAARQRELPSAVDAYAAMSTAYRAGEEGEFNRVLRGYKAELEVSLRPELRKVRAEAQFRLLQPFYRSMEVYVLAFLVICVYWVRLSERVRRSAVWLTAVALGIHTAGLLYRMLLEGRPPVTNLYSSAVFIGWGSAFLGLILERFHRTGLGVATASGVGFSTLIVAHHLSMGGDTMEMMRAVLDSNFWLATHVVTITVGYSAMFVAGFLGILYILRCLLTRSMTELGARSVGRLIYGIICFATLFSFVGTVLGGIWADQSWGRFWGWDPKENGALMIVLWCAVMLHARWGGWVRERGLAAMAIFGNVVTAFSWFGTNMLGVGLHSYGFMDAGFKWLVFFVITQVVLIGLACVPTHRWSRFKGAPG
jgi:ABC-type transport system involved in cytochrome c biogenesis permease subunit